MSSSSAATSGKRERVPASDELESSNATQQPPRSPEHERLHASFRDDQHYLQQMVALDRNKRSDRVDAILSLKGSLEKTSTEIQSRNAKQNRKTQEIEEEDARRFQELLNQGKNPYEVARTRTVRETADKERKKIEHHIQEKQVSILKHLEVEKVWVQRQERVKQEQQAYEKKYQKEMGRAAVEARTKDYLVSRTGKETIDPTGKVFRLYPSQETTIKDRSFGLGKNLVHDAEQRHKIVVKIHRKRAHRDAPGAAPASMLLPRVEDAANTNNNNAAERGHSPSLSMLATSTPGQELRDLNHSVVERDAASKTALPPLAGRSPSAGSDSPSNATKKKGFGKPQRSVLEQRMLEQARERQKSNIFQKQVVWGKEFTGRAFLADPPEIWFKDFDVGVPMTLHFTLTNVSNTFNHFKLLDLDESIKECFEIQFEKPGRMSAGMACRISITFTATEARDIDSLLPAVAQTGPFSVPLLCTCKKAVPVLEKRTLVFKDVVAGEKQVLTLKLENQGALPLEFRVRRLLKKKSSGSSNGPEQDEGDVVNGQRAEDAVDDADIKRRQEELLLEGAGDPSSDGIQSTGEISSSEDHPEATEVVDSGDREADSDDIDGTDAALLTRNPSATGSLASSSPGTSLHLTSSRVPLSSDEQNLLEVAKSATVYRPEGADTPIRHTSKGTVGPYASASISFTFAPAAPMEIEDELFIVEFPDAATTHRKAFWSQKLLAAIPVSISAHASHVPIFVEQSVLDFRCCLYDRLYRNQLTVCNRGSIALKMQIRVPKALEDCVEFNPNMGFVQGSTSKDDDAQAGKFVVQIKFRPHAAMWKRLEAKSFGSASLGFLAIPIQVVVPDQVIPVYFILMARVSPAALAFSHKRLDFGACVLGHSVAHTLQITNTSRLPQRLAFLKLPSEVRLEDPESTANVADDGVATLLPQEIRVYRVVYQPNASATTLSSRLVCRTSTNDEYMVTLAGECLASPVVFSHSVLQLGATQLGQTTTHSITCANNSEKPQTLELVVPPGAETFLRITPTVVTVAPRSSVRIEVEFSAQDEIYELPASEYSVVDSTDETNRKATMPASSVTVSSSRQEPTTLTKQTRNILTGTASAPSWVGNGGVPAEGRSIHNTWSVLCFRKQSDAQTVAFQVRTTVVDAKLFTTPKDLDFGQVAIGQTLVRELKLTNNSVADVQLRANALHALGGFRMINSVQRTIPARGGVRSLKMEFRPTAPLLYDDELELFCPELGVIRVALSGEGVNPSLRIVPEDGVIDFKDVLARNRASSELQLTNASAFPLTLSIVPLDGEPGNAFVTSAGLPPFTFSPSVATIPAQATLSVKVLFFPDHQRPQHYHQKYLIQVPNESERHVITLTGRCWENQLYVFNPHEPPKLFAAPAVEDLFDVPPSINLASLLAGGAAASLITPSLAVPGIKKAAAPLTVVFGGEAETPTTESKTIYIGGTSPPATEEDVGGQKTGAAIGTFEFVVEENPDKPQYAKMFTLEPIKGAISTAQQLPIQLTYQPPQGAAAAGSDGVPEPVAHLELVVSQWIQVRVTCTLKGGVLWRPLPAAGTAPVASGAPSGGKAAAPAATNSGESDTRVVQLVLRAKMHT